MSECQAPALVQPSPGELHLWSIQLDVDPSCLERYRDVLHPTEKARAARLIRDLDRDRFVAGRGCLRVLLGAYLERAPESIEFHYNGQGKPSLARSPSGPFAFNLSHSRDIALCAVAGFETVGVDIEAVKVSRDLIPIARRFFSSEEQEQLLALPADQQCPAFYQCWTSKEALLKAWGTGLSTPLDRFTVQVAPGAAGVLAIDIPERAGQPWQVYPVGAPDGFAAAVALPGPVQDRRVFPWPVAK